MVTSGDQQSTPAVGDSYTGVSASVANNGYVDLATSGTLEVVIHNIYHGSTIQIEYYDGTNSVIVDTDSGLGIYARYSFHCNVNYRIRIKNTSGSPQNIGFDGVVTHT